MEKGNTEGKERYKGRERQMERIIDDKEKVREQRIKRE